jgi:hypothetical protein
MSESQDGEGGEERGYRSGEAEPEPVSMNSAAWRPQVSGSNWGGSDAEVWTPASMEAAAVSRLEEFRPHLDVSPAIWRAGKPCSSGSTNLHGFYPPILAADQGVG